MTSITLPKYLCPIIMRTQEGAGLFFYFQVSNECQPSSSILKLDTRYDTTKLYLNRKLLELLRDTTWYHDTLIMISALNIQLAEYDN